MHVAEMWQDDHPRPVGVCPRSRHQVRIIEDRPDRVRRFHLRGASRERLGDDVAIDIFPAQEGISFYATLTPPARVGGLGLRAPARCRWVPGPTTRPPVPSPAPTPLSRQHHPLRLPPSPHQPLRPRRTMVALAPPCGALCWRGSSWCRKSMRSTKLSKVTGTSSPMLKTLCARRLTAPIAITISVGGIPARKTGGGM